MCLSRFHKRVCESERERERERESGRQRENAMVGVTDRVMRRASEKISHR